MCLLNELLVLGQIPPDDAQKDHKNYTSKENNYHRGIKDQELVDLHTLNLQIRDPYRGPLDIVFTNETL